MLASQGTPFQSQESDRREPGVAWSVLCPLCSVVPAGPPRAAALCGRGCRRGHTLQWQPVPAESRTENLDPGELPFGKGKCGLKFSRKFVFNQPFFFKKKILFSLSQGRRGGDREGEKHQCVVTSCTPPTGDLACNPGMWPDWELNWGCFGSQAGTQSTEPHRPGLNQLF